MMEEKKDEILPMAVYSYKELSEVVGVGLRTFYKWARLSKLSRVKIGRKFAVLGSDFLDHLHNLACGEEFVFLEEEGGCKGRSL
jgi:excisionase family DNA binding protein